MGEGREEGVRRGGGNEREEEKRGGMKWEWREGKSGGDREGKRGRRDTR